MSLRPILRTWLRWTLRALGAVLLVLVVAYALRVPLFGGLVKREITAALSDALGGRYEIDGVGGNWITEFEIRGLRTVQSPDEGALTDLEAEFVRVRYDLRQLLGDTPEAGLLNVVVDGLRVALDPARPSGGASDGEAAFSLPEALRPEVDVRGNVEVVLGQERAMLRDLHVAFGPDRDLALDVGTVDLPDRLGVDGPLAGEVVKVDGERWRWRSEAEIGGVRVPEATITARGDVDARVEVAGGAVALRVADEQLEARIEAFDLAALPAWVRELVGPAAPLPTNGGVDGTITMSIPSAPALEFDLAVRDLHLEGQRVDEGRVKGRWDGGRMISALDVTGSGRGLVLRALDVTLDLEHPLLLRRAASIDLELDDLRRVLDDVPREARVELRARTEGDGVLAVEEAVLTSRGDGIALRGTVRMPAAPERWRETDVDLTFDGRVADPWPLDVAWEGATEVEGTIRGKVIEPILTLQARGSAWRVETYAIERLTLSGRVGAYGVDLLKADVEGPDGVAKGEGLLQWSPFLLDLTALRFATDDAGPLAARLAADAPPLSACVEADGRLRIADDGWRATGSLDVVNAIVDGTRVGDLRLRLIGDADGVDVEALEASGPWGRAQAAGRLRPEHGEATIDGLRFDDGDTHVALRQPLTVHWGGSEVRLRDLSLLVDGTRIDAELRLDPNAGRAEVVRAEAYGEAMRVRLLRPLVARWDAQRVVVEDLGVRVGDDLELRAAATFDRVAERLVVSRLEADADFGHARLRRPLVVLLRGDAVEVRDLDVDVADVHIEGLAPAVLAWDDDGVELQVFDVRAFGARVRGRGAWRDGPELDVGFTDLALAPFVEGLDGAVRGRVQWKEGVLDGFAEVPAFRHGAWEGGARVAFHQTAEGPLEVTALSIHGPEGRRVEGSARLPLRVGPEGLARLDDVEPSLRLDGTLGGMDRLNGVADGPVRLSVRGDAEGLTAQVTVTDVGLGAEGEAYDDVVGSLRIDRQGGSLEIRLGADTLAAFHGVLSVDRGFDWTRPEGIAEVIRHARVEGSLHGVVRSWKPLAVLAPGIDRLEGAAGIDLEVSGPLRSPRIVGALRLSNFALALDGDVAPFEDVNADLRWEGDRVVVETLEGLMGYAPFEIGGEIGLPPGGGLPVFDLTLRGRNTQLLRTDWTRLRFDIDATVQGPMDALVASGKGEIVDAVFREPVSLSGAGAVDEQSELVLFEIEDWPFSDMHFDLDVIADRSIRVRNNFLRVDVSFEGRLEGTGLRPEPVGRASFENADVFLPLTTLRGGRGEVVFERGSPFRPRVQLTAGTRTRGYELGVQIAGSLPDVNVYVFTEPRLEEEDAILMLTTGSTGAELADGGLVGKALAAVINMFGGSVLTTRNEEGEPGSKAFFERFEFSTDWDGTAITGLDGEVELTERFYLHLERDRFENTNVGLIWRIRFR